MWRLSPDSAPLALVASAQVAGLKTLRVLRALRLVKMARLVRASRIVKRRASQDLIRISSGSHQMAIGIASGSHRDR